MKPILVFDSGCGPCTRFKNAISFLDTREKMRYVGLDNADQEGLLQAVPANLRHRSFHLVSSDGQAWSGAAAFPELARLLPAGRLSGALLQRSVLASRAAGWLYLVFSRLHDVGACSYRGPGSTSTSISTSMNKTEGSRPSLHTGV